jgi:polyisoprenoid-binding protein YceI
VSAGPAARQGPGPASRVTTMAAPDRREAVMTAPLIREPIPVTARGGTYRIDPARSRIQFTTRHLFGLGLVCGTVALRDGEVHVAARVEESHARAIVSAASISTGNSARDRIVRSPRLLDVEAQPDISFVSERLSDADGDPTLRGYLTIRGIARAITLRITEVEFAGAELTARATTRIDRYAFGVTRYRGLAARNLEFHLDLVAVRDCDVDHAEAVRPYRRQDRHAVGGDRIATRSAETGSPLRARSMNLLAFRLMQGFVHGKRRGP